jgi:hypothetical protein
MVMDTPQITGTVISRKSTIRVNGPLNRVFPLFGPVREREWAHGWDPRIVYSTTGLVEEHMVFQTKTEYAGQESEKTWVVSLYDPVQAIIEYTVFTSARLYWIAIRCWEDPAKKATLADISYTFTALTAAGQALIEKAVQDMFAHDLKDWESAINQYLAGANRPHRD